MIIKANIIIPQNENLSHSTISSQKIFCFEPLIFKIVILNIHSFTNLPAFTIVLPFSFIAFLDFNKITSIQSPSPVDAMVTKPLPMALSRCHFT